jgi:hypothetical protein
MLWTPILAFLGSRDKVKSLQHRFDVLQPNMAPNVERTQMTLATEAPVEVEEKKEAPKPIFLKDYKKPDYLFDEVRGQAPPLSAALVLVL